MNRLMLSLCGLAFGSVLALTLLIQPSRASAGGGLSCFLCHGVNFEGSDIAPRVAGIKLTDEEILKQMHSPRGVMPAFNEGASFDKFALEYIRSQPAGRPTSSLPPQQRSAALATISAVAAARATAVLQTSSSAISATPTPARTAVLATAASASSSSTTPTESSLGMFIMLGGLLTVIAGVLWARQRQ